MSQVFLFLTKFNYIPIVKFYIKDNFITFKITVKVASDVNRAEFLPLENCQHSSDKHQ